MPEAVHQKSRPSPGPFCVGAEPDTSLASARAQRIHTTAVSRWSPNSCASRSAQLGRRRNYALYLVGLGRVICPVADGSGTAGATIFDADPEDVDQIMRQDPAARVGLFTSEIHPTQTFPESHLANASTTRLRSGNSGTPGLLARS
jgi:hypothetical protein